MIGAFMATDGALRQSRPAGQDALENGARLEMECRFLIVGASAPVGCRGIRQNTDQIVPAEDFQVVERQEQGLADRQGRESGRSLLDVR
jgi:hypothetical protein